MYLAYTSESNSRSNAPLQNITMFYGTPCAFNDRRAHLAPGQLGPVLYPLEKENKKSECGNFFKDSKMSGEAEDKRFSSIFSADVTEKPNEYDI